MTGFKHQSVSKPNFKPKQNFFKDALALHSRGDISKAIDLYKLAINNQDNIVPSLLNLGVIYNTVKHYDRAIDVYTQALKLDPNNTTVFSNYANVMRSVGDLDCALKLINRALEIDSSMYQALLNKAIILMDLALFDEALDTLSSCIRLNDSFAPSHAQLGLLYLKTNKLLLAKKSLAKALHLDHTNVFAKTVLAQVLQSLGLHGEASRYLQESDGKILFDLHDGLKILL